MIAATHMSTRSKKQKVALAYEPPVKVARTSLILYVNGDKYEVANVLPTMTLLEYLRSIGLTGTKLGCGEGGCGACTVMVSSFDPASKSVRHAAVNAWCVNPDFTAHHEWKKITCTPLTKFCASLPSLPVSARVSQPDARRRGRLVRRDDRRGHRLDSRRAPPGAAAHD